MVVSGNQCFAVLAITALGSLCAGTAAWAQYDYEREDGYVRRCSLEGVNPAHHPEIFGNPAAASEYGFIRSRDGTWQLRGECHGQPTPAAPSAGRPQRKR
jgi:hypothetical protein